MYETIRKIFWGLFCSFIFLLGCYIGIFAGQETPEKIVYSTIEIENDVVFSETEIPNQMYYGQLYKVETRYEDYICLKESEAKLLE